MISELRNAVRQLLKPPGFAALAIVMLALGIGANTALFSVVYGVLLRPLPFEEQERLVTLWESDPARGIEQQQVSPPGFAVRQERNRSFEALAFWTGPTEFNFVTEAASEKVKATFGSSSLFPILRVQPRLGRGFLPEEDRPEGPPTAVISHDVWQTRYGGDPQILGRSFTVDTFGRRTYTIVGVMPAGFRFPDGTDFWLAAGWNGLPRDRWSGHWLNVLGRLKPGVDLGQATVDFHAIQGRLAREHAGASVGTRVSLVPLLRQTVGGNTRTALWALWGTVGGVLLIACANVANLLLVRAVSRRKEIALRLALGAGRWRVVRQLLLESVLLALIGAALGALLAVWGVKAFVAACPSSIPRLAEVSVDGAALGFTSGLALLTGLVFGLMPARQCARTDLDEVLKAGGRGSAVGGTGARARSWLIVAEVALALLLLVGAGLMLQSLAGLLSVDRGFQANSVLTAELDFSISGYTTWVRPTATRPQVRLRELLERVRQLPGVEAAAAAYQFLRRDNRPPAQSFAIHGRPLEPEGQRPVAGANAVTPDYLRTLGMRLLRGRDFTEADRLESPGVALVNEAFVRRHFPREDPLGKHLTLSRDPGGLEATDPYGIPVWSEIVGVVSDVKSLSTQPEVAPEIYRPYWQWPMQSPVLYVRTKGSPAALRTALRQTIQAVIPNLPAPKLQELSTRVSESVAEPRFLTLLLCLFGGVALLLAAGGIYGLLAYSVSQRQGEIGVRLALGAQRRNILSLVILQGLKLTFMGVGVGLLGALGLARLLASLLYGITPADPTTLAGVSLLLAGVAVLACWLPARAAANLDAMAALRKE